MVCCLMVKWHYPRERCLSNFPSFMCICKHNLWTTKNQQRTLGFPLSSFFFFFQAPPATDPVVQWSVQWPNDITILNRAGVQWLCRATPEGRYASTPKSPRNWTWPPGNVPHPTGHLSSRACEDCYKVTSPTMQRTANSRTLTRVR